jgi:hypothetical protein
VDTRIQEHQQHIRLEQKDKSAVAEHCVDSGHRILFHDTSVLATKTRYMDCIVREAIEIELHPNNINRDVRFCLSKSWKPLISSPKKSLQHEACTCYTDNHQEHLPRGYCAIVSASCAVFLNPDSTLLTIG